ncbi:MAG: EFR1 family ferrodoxin, partial [Bacteroidales bacterium]|nr:EFR1 family ferrodoxin [Bacteroidales bacterium]
MDKAIIYYFSGTGNAARVAQWLDDEFAELALSSSVFSIVEKQNLKYPEQDDKLIGFCYPTHGFNVIPVMLHFILRFPRGNNQSVFLMNTRAGMKLSTLFVQGLSGAALFFPAIILMLKGYRIVGLRSIDLPSNWVSLHPGLRNKVVDSMFIHWEQKARQFARKIIDGKKVYRGFYDLPVDVLLTPIAALYYFVGRFGLSKTFMPNHKCNNCNQCVKDCPLEAIIYKNNRPYWTFRCESCMKCINLCPQKAIQTTHMFTVYSWHYLMIISSLFIAIVVRKFFPGLQTDSTLLNLLLFCLESALGLGLIWVVYYIAHALLRYKWVERMMYYSSLTNYKFWRNYFAPGRKTGKRKT